MWISELTLTRWRNHEQTHVSFQPGVTLFVGPNGQGKTNLLEAIRYLATLGSHRVTGSSALIGDNHPAATIFATLRHEARDVSVGLTVKRQGSSEATVSGNKAKVSEVPRWVSAVLFAPEDASIIRGEPGFRRAFVDELVISTSPSMAVVYQDFERVLKQRNSLLKSLRSSGGRADLSTLEVWNANFVALAADIVQARMSHVSSIMPMVNDNYGHLAGGHSVSANYLPKGYALGEDSPSRGDIALLIDEALIQHRSEELDRGLSLIGPQRDDVELLIAGKPARSHASQGETWSLALALRLATAAWLRQERSSGDPIIMLDDVFAELDAQRRARLVEIIRDYHQIVITSAVEEDVPSELTGQILDVSQGVVSTR